MNDVTQLLNAADQGDPQAAGQLLPLVYEELRRLAAHRLAQEKPGHTLQATALVHEAYLRLVGSESAPDFNSCGHFFAAAAEFQKRALSFPAFEKQHGTEARKRLDLYGRKVAYREPPPWPEK